MKIRCIRQLVAVQVSLQYAGMVRRANTKFLSWIILELPLTNWSMDKRSTMKGYSNTPPKWYVHPVNRWSYSLTCSHAQLSALESLHTWHYIHCDIKPANFVVRADGPWSVSYPFDAPCKRLWLTAHVFIPTHTFLFCYSFPHPTFLLYPNFASRYTMHWLGTLVPGILGCDVFVSLCHVFRHLIILRHVSILGIIWT